MTAISPDLIDELRQALGADAVLTGVEAREQLPPRAQAEVLLRPRSTEQVSAALRLCHAASQPVVAQGGLTGLVLGAVPGPDEIALSLSRMRAIEEVDTVNRCMTVQAGVPLQAAQEAAEQAQLMLALDLGARGSATVGGNVATNAGGNRVLRFGMMREMVLGLTAVLADGTIVDSRSKILKNNTGYDLKQLFIGSEGTLGIVTRVVLRLRPLPRSHNTALCALDGFEQVIALLETMEAALAGSLSSFEVMWREFYETVTTPPAKGQAPLPRGHAYYALIETLGSSPERDHDALASALEEAQERGLLADAVLAASTDQRRAMWGLRDDVEQLGREGPVFSYDVSLPLDAMAAYVGQVREALQRRFGDHRCYVFGHLADGNLHLVVGVKEARAYPAVSDLIYGALGEHSSISAEHGIGTLKKRHLHLSRSEVELELMRRLKHALDPRNILGRGRVLDP